MPYSGIYALFTHYIFIKTTPLTLRFLLQKQRIPSTTEASSSLNQQFHYPSTNVQSLTRARAENDSPHNKHLSVTNRQNPNALDSFDATKNIKPMTYQNNENQ